MKPGLHFRTRASGAIASVAVGIAMLAGCALASPGEARAAGISSLSACQYAEIPKGVIAGDGTALSISPSDRHTLDGFLQAHGQNHVQWTPCQGGNRVYGATISAKPDEADPKSLTVIVSGSGGDGFLDDMVMHVAAVNIPKSDEFLIHVPFQTHDGKEIIVSGKP